MLPAQRNKIDISKLNPQEQQLFAKYGKLPTHKNVLMKMQKERKYFDSGDYAMSKAGVAPPTTVGTAIPNPENIPHASPSPGNGHGNGHQGLSISPTGATSPVKESALSHDEDSNVPDEGQMKAEESTLETESDVTTEVTSTIAIDPASVSATAIVEEAKATE